MQRLPRPAALLLLAVVAVSAVALPALAQPGCSSNVQYDVCVVGAGGSGMYAAWRLAQTKNLSVLVLEKDDRVGGNCETYYLNAPPLPTPIPLETWVVLYVNTSLVAQTLQLLGIGASPISQGLAPGPAYNWSRDGTTFNIPNFAGLQIYAGYLTWVALFRQYFEPYDTLTTTGQLPVFSALPSDVRQRFLSPFSAFLAELHPDNVTALTPLFQVFAGSINVGFASWLDNPAYFTAAGVNPAVMKPIFLTPTTTADGFTITSGCSSIYEAMAAALGSDKVVLNAAFDVKRQQNAVKIKVTAGTKWKTGSAASGTVFCRRLLISATPTLENLGTFMNIDKELDDYERGILSQVTHNTLSTHLVPLAAPVSSRTSHVVIDARFEDAPTTSSVSTLPGINLLQGYTTNLNPQWTVARGLAQLWGMGAG